MWRLGLEVGLSPDLGNFLSLPRSRGERDESRVVDYHGLLADASLQPTDVTDQQLAPARTAHGWRGGLLAGPAAACPASRRSVGSGDEQERGARGGQAGVYGLRSGGSGGGGRGGDGGCCRWSGGGNAKGMGERAERFFAWACGRPARALLARLLW